MQETCMCWGLEVPEDWLPVIDQLCGCMQTFGYTSREIPKRPQVVAEQVKSKWDRLRFYFHLEWPDDDGVTLDKVTPEKQQAMDDYKQFVDGMVCLAEYQIEVLENARRDWRVITFSTGAG